MKYFLYSLLLFWVFAATSQAKTTAIALSGGGARGFAHIGLLQVLEEENLRPDLIVGTSMGAVMGGLYASGYSAAELRSMALNTDWSNLFLDRPSRRNLFLGKKETSSRHILSLRFRGWSPEVPVALSSGQKLTELLFDYTRRAPYQPWPSFDDLKIPYRAVATDLVTGEPVIFSHGDLAEAMRAAVALPLVFTPYRLDTLVLADGGVIENIPVESARKLGADVVIAVDVSTGLGSGYEVDKPWELADRVSTIMHRERNRTSLDKSDLVIAPEIGSHSSTDFGGIAQMIDEGYRAARAKLPELRILLAKTDSVRRPVSFTSRVVFEKFQSSYSPPSLPPAKCSFAGVTLIPDSILQSLPPGKDGLSRYDLLRKTYLDDGYSLAHLTEMRVEADSTLYSRWEEGRIHRIQVSGLIRQTPQALLREFPLHEGELFSLRRAKRGMAQMYGSDLYDHVTLSILPTDSGADLTIRAKERSSPQLRFGAGYSFERGGRSFGEFLNDNFLNWGSRLALFGKYGERDKEAHAGLSFDRLPFSTHVDEILQSSITTDLNVCWKREDYTFYTPDHHDTSYYYFERIAAELWVGRAFRRWAEISYGARYETVRAGGVLDEPAASITYLRARMIVDTKDSYPFPTSGFSFNGRYEYAVKSRDNGRAFNRMIVHSEAYVPLTRRLVLHGGGGWAWNDRLLPLWAQFPLGGEESLLGLHVAERYGACRLMARGELRYDLLSRWLADAYFSLRYTVGAVSMESQPLPSSREYQHGVGASFALSTFLGPMKFTAGELLRSRYGPRDMRLYLNLGHEF